jgi:hypothetical protein
MRVDAVQLAQQHAHPGRLARHLDPEQLPDCEHEDELVVLEGDVVDPLGYVIAFHHVFCSMFFSKPVQVADHRVQPDDRLAVQVDHEPEHAGVEGGSGRS